MGKATDNTDEHRRDTMTGGRAPHETLLTLAGRATGVVSAMPQINRSLVRTQETIRESERVLRTQLANFPGMVYRCLNDPDRTMIFVSEGCLALTGYERDELLDNRVVAYGSLVHPEDREGLREKCRDSLAALAPCMNEYRIIDRAGRTHRVWERTTGVYDADGRLQSIEGFVQDVTPRRRMEAEQAKLALLVQNSQDFIGMCDMQGIPFFVNRAGMEMVGLEDIEQACTTPVREFFFPEDQAFILEDFFPRVLRTGSDDVEIRFRHFRSGEALWMNYAVFVLRGHHGAPVGLATVSRNITERKRSEENQRLAANVFAHMAEGILITDEKGALLSVNTAFTRITGYDMRYAAGRTFVDLCGDAFNLDDINATWDALALGGRWEDEVRCRRADGGKRILSLRVTAVRDAHDRVVNYVAMLNDITGLKQSKEQLEYVANYDRLTELPNRHMFMNKVAHAIDHSSTQAPLAVLIVDLDDFNIVNDTVGHDAGDLLLKEVSARLRRCVRRIDVLGRLGGDEFAVLLDQVKDAHEAARTAQRILHIFVQPVPMDGHEVFIAGSIGISMYPDDGTDSMTLLRNADAAMYRAKKLGKNQYHFFEENIGLQSRERLSLETRLRRAVERNEFELHYQPQVTVETVQRIGVEALIRWRHPEEGLMAPLRFIPLAEQTGLIVPIGEWTLRTACAQAAQWLAEGCPVTRVGVNLSMRHLREKNLSRLVTDTIGHAGIPASCLELEITESAVMDDARQAVRVLHELAEIGVQIAIDDFGTGYSSLSYLKRFPIDRIKIDRTFISDIPADADDTAIVTAIIALSRSLNVKTIAEGVETEAQLWFLATKGCDEAQGYYFGRPQPPDAIDFTHSP